MCKCFFRKMQKKEILSSFVAIFLVLEDGTDEISELGISAFAEMLDMGCWMTSDAMDVEGRTLRPHMDVRRIDAIIEILEMNWSKG